VAGLVVAAIQAGSLLAAGFIWRRTAGSWGGGAYAGYFLALVILAPVVAWKCASRVVDTGTKAWHAWPVSLTSLVVLLFGHGFEEAGLPFLAPVAAMAMLSMLVGTLAFLRRDYRRVS
jgi:hypothetical protein